MAFVQNSPEAATAYGDTIGDLALGLLGGTIAAVLVSRLGPATDPDQRPRHGQAVRVVEELEVGRLVAKVPEHDLDVAPLLLAVRDDVDEVVPERVSSPSPRSWIAPRSASVSEASQARISTSSRVQSDARSATVAYDSGVSETSQLDFGSPRVAGASSLRHRGCARACPGGCDT